MNRSTSAPTTGERLNAMNGSTPTLLTDRLLLVIPGASAAEARVRYYRDNSEHLQQWEPPIGPEFLDAERHREWLDAYVALALEDKSYRFIVFDRNEGPDGEILGHINLHNIIRGVNQSAILGYHLSKRHEGKGVMTEAGHAVISFAFETLALHRLNLNYQPANVRSEAVAKRLGFEIEGVARSLLFLHGAWRDHVMTSLINPAQCSEIVTVKATISLFSR